MSVSPLLARDTGRAERFRVFLGLAGRSTGSLSLLAWSLAILAATLYPYNFDTKLTGREILQVSAQESWEVLDLALNILLFVPLGALLALRLRQRAYGYVMTTIAAGASAFTLAFSIEFLQRYLPSRTSSLADVLSNTVGALIGARAWRASGGSFTAQLQSLRDKASPAVRAGALAGCSIAALVVSGVLQYGARPSNWDERFFLLIGNEHTGDRPWRGRVFRIDLSDAATPKDLVRAFAAGDSRDLRPGGLSAIKFANSSRFDDTADHLPAFVWMGPVNASTAVGLKVTDEAWLQSGQPPKEIARRIRASNEFTLRVICASDSAHQAGPARILSYSLDPMQRNFTLGQEGPDMVFRLRTPNTGPNGTRIPLVVPGVFSSGAIRDILVTYSASTLRIAVAGSDQDHSLELSPGTSLAGFYLLPRPEHAVYFNLVYYGLVFLPQLGLLAWLMPNTTRYFAVGLVWLLTFSVALEGMLAFAGPRQFDWTHLAISLAAASVVLFVFAVKVEANAILARRDS